jgi:preprotein translocase subunit YajC
MGFDYLIVLVALFVLMWFLLIRPQRRRTQVQTTMQDRLRAGDQIITAGGLHATVRSIEEDVLEIELAPGMVVKLDRRAVAGVVSEQEPDGPAPDGPDELEAGTEEPIPSDDG